MCRNSVLKSRVCCFIAPSVPAKSKILADMVTCSKVNSIRGQIENLQSQLDELVMSLKPQSMDSFDRYALPSPSQHQRHAFEAKFSPAPRKESSDLTSCNVNEPKRSMPRFYGSSSSEYSLNLAQTKLGQTQDLDDSPICET